MLCGAVPLRAADTPVNTDALKMQVDRLSAAAERADWAEVDRVQEELQRSGSAAIPLLLERMRQDGGSRNAKFHLLDTLRRIPGEKTTETLLDLVLNDKDRELAESAAAAIPDQIILRRKFSEPELEKLVSRISDNRLGVAAKWSFLLARADQMDKQRVVGPIIERFAKEMHEITGQSGTPPDSGSYMSRQALAMNSFLRVFPFLESSVSIPLLKQTMSKTNDPSDQKWFLMALGMSGDRQIADTLRQIVESREEEVSVRALALRAYALATNEDAVPFLQLYENDATSGPNPRYPPLRLVAKDELARIRAKR